MNSEVEFLASQQARLDAIEKKSAQRSEHADAIHSFWERLRSTLAKWEASLEKLGKDDSISKSDGARDGASKHQNANQQLLDLKLELQQFQKHCLGSVVVFEDWEVPVLPVADLRLMHNVFSKHLTKWEQVQQEIAPKGKFVFRRYREELARRNAAQQTITQPTGIGFTNGLKMTEASNAVSGSEGALLSHFHESSIVIAVDGSVRVNDETVSLKITEAALLMRNLKKCSVTVFMKLMTLHIVDSTDTEIVIQEPVGSAIHVTGCHSCQLQASGQQLRLHDSTELYCKVHIGAGAILEDCNGIVFVTTKLMSEGDGNDSSIDVRDFNWLRSGEPSPNYEIRQVEMEEPTKQAPEMDPMDNGTQDSTSPKGDSSEQPANVQAISEPVVTVVEAPQESPPATTAQEDSDDDDEL